MNKKHIWSDWWQSTFCWKFLRHWINGFSQTTWNSKEHNKPPLALGPLERRKLSLFLVTFLWGMCTSLSNACQIFFFSCQMKKFCWCRSVYTGSPYSLKQLSIRIPFLNTEFNQRRNLGQTTIWGMTISFNVMHWSENWDKRVSFLANTSLWICWAHDQSKTTVITSSTYLEQAVPTTYHSLNKMQWIQGPNTKSLPKPSTVPTCKYLSLKRNPISKVLESTY